MNEILAPEDLSRSAKTAYADGDYEKAIELFRAAAEGYRLADSAVEAAETNNNLSVALLQLREAEPALEAVEGTAEVFAAAGDLHRQALALGNRAAALAELGRKAEAEEAYVESAELLRQLGEDEHHASVMRAISELQLRSGRHLEAVASMQTGLDGIKKPKLQHRMLRRLLKMPFKLINRS